MGRGFRDKDYLETRERLMFCVVGSTHPADMVISYLKYMPSKDGGWESSNLKFRRVIRRYTMPDLMDTLRLLRSRYPGYLFYSHVYHIEMSGVPVKSIRRHYTPETRLSELMEKPPEDRLIEKLIELVELLSQLSGVSTKNFGVTGSILLGLWKPELSDIDLTVYGWKNCRKVKEGVLQAFNDEEVPVSRLNGSEGHRWCERRVRECPISFRDAEKMLERTWRIGLFKGTRFSVNPVRTEEEAERYGDRVYHSVGYGRIQAVVSDGRESFYTPAKYLVEEVRVLEGPRDMDLREVSSYEGIYADIAHEEETIEARGKIEVVEDRLTGETYHRLLVGTLEGRGRDYIRRIT
ncbi:hypothetical protein J7L06_05605 [Candidatus Bathyarchaeota archaeon]|nr:hypothetical protein [Candidatus Bathyarchaeota archaeon]